MNFFKKHKFISALIIIALAGGSYYGYKKLTAAPAVTRYVLGTVSRDTIVASVSGSGQVAVKDQVDIKAKASGDLLSLKGVNGQAVKKGFVLAQLDSTDARKAVRDAQSSLASAQLSLDKTKRGSLPSTLEQEAKKIVIAQQDLADANANLVTVNNKAAISLANTCSDAKNNLQDTYNKADDIINRQLTNFFTNFDSINPQLSFLTTDSAAANDSDWKLLNAKNAVNELDALLNDSFTDPAVVNDSLDKAVSQLNIIQDFLLRLNVAVNAGIVSTSFPQSSQDSYQSSVNSARNTINTTINNITAQKQALVNQQLSNNDSVKSAQDQIRSSQNSLNQLQDQYSIDKSGADPLDLQAQVLSVQQKQNALLDAQQKLADYSVAVPFDGILSVVSANVGDSISSGGVIATLITKQEIAKISLNEVDVAKVKLGHKVNLTFDAVSDLELTGEVTDIDTIGTVSQGVVSYNVEIGFDAQDDRIKPGMTVSAEIITDVRTDVLTVANSAIKQNGVSYVEMIDNPIAAATGTQGVTSLTAPRRQTVTTGLSNDTVMEITSGLKEGDQVIIKTISSTAVTTQTSTTKSTGGGAGGLLRGF
jgi:RND family efflux transporter MFP subunit